MYHLIEFGQEVVLDLQIAGKDRSDLLLLDKGSRRRTRVRPYVIDTDDGPVEMADLAFEDGTAANGVRCECFAFVD